MIERSRRRSLAHVFLGVSSRGAAADSAMAQMPVEARSVNALISRCSGPCRRAAPVHKRFGPRAYPALPGAPHWPRRLVTLFFRP
jgi:hypothetical protein